MKQKIWTGKYWMTTEHILKISKKLKAYYKIHQIWNKGRKLENPITNKIRRADKDYYLKELELNAIREPKYRSEEKTEKDKVLRKKRADRCKYFGKQKWTEEEISFLENNYKQKFAEEIALKLKRSLSSISHKLGRLKLLKNHKWKL